MGFTVSVRPDHRLGLLRLTDEVDGPELIRAMHALYSDDAWRPGFGTVWDARPLRTLDVVPADLGPYGAASAVLVERQGPGRSAFLGRGPEDAVAAQLLELRRTGHPGRELRAFEGPGEAARWLGVPLHLLEGGEPERARDGAPPSGPVGTPVGTLARALLRP